MIHEEFRELIALRLYGEIDGEERARLERHLGSCETCARFASEIEAGLGALPRGMRSRAGVELPPDWTESLREATREVRVGRGVAPWWTAVAGFAAGVIATAVIVRGPALPAPPQAALSTWDRFHREEPPPLATTEGQLARLSEYLKR
jgi:anti-sigma factor RsiW